MFTDAAGIGRIGCLGFISGEVARGAAEACDARERLQFRREHHC